MIDIPTIRQWWDVFKNDGFNVEFRLFQDNKTYTGYFKDIEPALEDLQKFPNAAIYATLNPCVDACWSMAQGGKIILAGKNPTTSDKAIEGRSYILIDLDPERVAGTNASDQEKEYARGMMRNIFRHLRNVGFHDPVVADSANGYHLYYKVQLANTSENTELVKRFLEVLSRYFSDDHCKVDTVVYNAARIVKVIGTSSAKGRNTPERPQRMSKFIYIPEEFKITDKAFVEKVAAELPEPVKPSRENNYNAEPFDLDGFIDKYNIDVVKRVGYQGGEKIVLRECPFDHTHQQAAIFHDTNGAIGFKCFHNSCSQYTWKDVRLHFDPTAYDKKDYREYESRHRYDRYRQEQPKPEPKKEDEQIGKKWLDPTSIRYVNPNDFPFIPTGIEKIDKVMLGLTMGDVTIVSGSAGSGKTSLLDYIILNAVDKGYKVAAWSGELQDFRFMNWLDQMAAGKTMVEQQAGYDNIYYAPKKVAEKINRWLSGKFWLYNNSYGNKWSQILNDIKESLDTEKPDLIVVDNLTALELDSEGFDLNARQKAFINEAENLAKERNIHIILVCHPRKETNFHMLRMESIAGTADLFNLCDNVMIVHRGNNDLTQRMKEFFPKDVVDEYSGYDTLVEICKNRSHGRAGTLIGLYFERETRRFLNHFSENRVYGWNDTGMETFEPPQPIDNTIYNGYQTDNDLPW